MEQLNRRPSPDDNSRSQGDIYLSHWKEYYRLDLIPYPASSEAKAPLIKWKEEYPPERVEPLILRGWQYEYPNANIWAFLGTRFAVLDPDGPAAEEFVKSLHLPPCPTSISGGKSIHRWFRLASPIEPVKVKSGDGGLIEIRTGPNGMLVPPSIHPQTKRAYRWADGLSPWDIDFPELPIEIYNMIKSLAGGANEGLKNPLGWEKEFFNKERKLKEGEGRNDAGIRLACYWLKLGLNPERVLFRLLTWNSEFCEPMKKEEVQGIWKSACKYFDDDKKNYQLSDLGNAHRLVDLHGKDILYCKKKGGESWLVWGGSRWKPDELETVKKLAMESMELVLRDAIDIEDDNLKSAVRRHALRSQQSQRINGMLDLAAPLRPVLREVFDRDDWLLNAENGVINLKTGELLPHKKEDYITKIVRTHYDQAAECPTWEKFLDRIMQGNEGLIAYLQRVTGYALTGSTREQNWIFVYGPTATGKTTYLETVRGMMGDYAISIDPSTLMVKRPDAIRSDIARMEGVRMVKAIETEQGHKLAEALMKAHTGEDTIVARYLYKNEFEFQPKHKIFLGSNYMPEIKRMDDAQARRLNVIPFNVIIPLEKRDRDLKEKLKAEWPGILAWAVRGCLEWQEIGLSMPPEVLRATEEYRREMDVISRFKDECCNIGEQEWVTAGNFRKAICKWAAMNGEKIDLDYKAIKSWFSGKPEFKRRRGNPVKYSGIGLKPEFYEQGDTL